MTQKLTFLKKWRAGLRRIVRAVRERSAFCLFLLSCAIVMFAYGFAVGRYHIFPDSVFELAKKGSAELLKRSKLANTWCYPRLEEPYPEPLINTSEAYPGLNLVTRMLADYVLSVAVMDLDGRVLHEWRLDWFELWPEPEHLPERFVPQSQPGTHIHGAILTREGDLIFNFEHRGLMRVDRDGDVIWRLPYQTHHSIHEQDDGNLWVCGQKEHAEASPRFPNRQPPFTEHMILEVSPEGEILREWSVAALFRKNGLEGLLHMGSLRNSTTVMLPKKDSLHLNDVEPFPLDMPEGFFGKGDVLVSLRNINTVFVFDSETLEIKFICIGRFVRQHDPDWLDGNRFSVFDNYNVAPADRGPQSRIAIVTAPSREIEIYFEGTDESPFFTEIMGKHQWLPNGNLLLTESCGGRAIEIDSQGEIVWQYVNYLDEGIVGIVEEVHRLPPEYASLFGGAADRARPHPE